MTKDNKPASAYSKAIGAILPETAPLDGAFLALGLIGVAGAMALAYRNASNHTPGPIPAPATSASGTGPGSAAPPAANAGHRFTGTGGNPYHDPKTGKFTGPT